MAFRVFIIILYLFFVSSASLLAQVSDTKTMDISFSVEPVFALVVDDEEYAVRFTKADIEQGAAEKSLRVNLITNAGRPYKVFVSPSGALSSSEGKIISEDFIMFSASGAKTGRVEIASPRLLDTAEQLIYTSGPKGESDSFILTFYLMSGGRIVPAGRYVANLSYRVALE